MLYDNDDIRIVGLTGMSGAGKTTACEVFAEKGFCIIDCDKVSRNVVEKGRPALGEIAAHFGEGILLGDGSLDRRKLGGIVFSDKQSLAALDGIIYPFIHFEIIRVISERAKAGETLFLLDAPTLFESGADVFCDCVVSVTADKDICRERIMQRDGLTREQAEMRLSSQHGRAFYEERSYRCIVNGGTREELVRHLDETAEEIMQGAYIEQT